MRVQWATGKRQRPSKCCACGQTQGIIDAHAEDYSEPFGDQTEKYHLCYRCHLILHCRHHDQAAWDKYRADIRSGLRYAPCFSRSFGIIKAHLCGNTGPAVQCEIPASFPLDEIEENSRNS